MSRVSQALVSSHKQLSIHALWIGVLGRPCSFIIFPNIGGREVMALNSTLIARTRFYFRRLPFFFFGGVTVWDSLDWLGLGWRRVWQLNRAAKGERCWYVCLYVRVAYLHARIVYNERIERD
jgi:hypothetical protein